MDGCTPAARQAIVGMDAGVDAPGGRTVPDGTATGGGGPTPGTGGRSTAGSFDAGGAGSGTGGDSGTGTGTDAAPDAVPVVSGVDGDGGLPGFSGSYEIRTGLLDGIYTLTATGTFAGNGNCVLSARSCGGATERMTAFPVSAQPTPIIVRGIAVRGGQCTVGYSWDGPAAGACAATNLTLTRDDVPYTFLKGGDATEISRVEQTTTQRFYDNGVATDPFVILKRHGFNIVRLRLFNDPGNPAFSPSRLMPRFANAADVLSLARRAKAQGLMIALTFHYSDYWTDAATQCLPHDWQGLSTFADVKTAMADFTRSFMMQMVSQQTAPEFVAIGNESNGGLLFPFGCAYAQAATTVCPASVCASANWAQLGQLYGATYDALKAVSPSTQVVIHLAYDNGATTAAASGAFNSYFANVSANQGRLDVKGLSYYPFWSRHTVPQFLDTADQIVSADPTKPLLIMESGYNWAPTRENGALGQLADNGPSLYPSTPAGQKDFLLELFAAQKLVSGGKCLGDLYWDPVNILKNSQVSNTALFDFGGVALPALDAYQYNN